MLMASWRISTSGYAFHLPPYLPRRFISYHGHTDFSQVDREKVLKEGRAAAGKLLIELQVRKSTADGPGARQFYTELTTPLPGWDAEIRDIVLKKKLVCHSPRHQFEIFIDKYFLKQPRKIFVQPNTFVHDDEVELREYPLTSAGVIQSFIEREL